jgi:type I restriction enzyme M protein
MFYTTNISVTLWILNKNKKAHSRNVGDEKRIYRNREKEILFMDLRQVGEPFEKKFIQFSEQQIINIGNTFGFITSL